MPTTDDSIVINAAPERIFDYITDPANFQSFQANTVHAELEGDGPIGVGSKIRGASRILGRTFDWTMEISVHDRPTASAFTSVEGKVGISGAYTLSPEGDGTPIHARSTLTSKRWHRSSPSTTMSD